jgi:hypothetical protein
VKRGTDRGFDLHRTAAHLEARSAYTAAMFNVLIGLERQFHPDHAFKLSIAEFSL